MSPLRRLLAPIACCFILTATCSADSFKQAIGESVGAALLTHEGWTDVDASLKNPRNGIDFIGYKAGPQGEIREVIFAEFKGYLDSPTIVDSANLTQGSKSYNLSRIDRLIEGRLDPIIAAGGEHAAVAKLKKDRMLTIRKFAENGARSIRLEVQVQDGRAQIFRYSINETGAATKEKALDFDLLTNRSLETRLRNAYWAAVEGEALKRNIPPADLRMIRMHFEANQISDYDKAKKLLESKTPAPASKEPSQEVAKPLKLTPQKK